MNHYVYQITNNINGKIYIGKRSCKCDIVDDSYIGSGTALKSAIKKYGIENFTKTIIEVCDSDKSAYELEKKIVDTNFVKRTDTYNICGGGIGVGIGESHPSFGKVHSEETRAKMSANCYRNSGMKGKTQSIETRSKISINNARTMKGKTGQACPSFGLIRSDETKAKMSSNHVGMKGKTHSEESREKISINNARAMQGKKLSPEQISRRNATRAANKLNKHGSFKL